MNLHSWFTIAADMPQSGKAGRLAATVLFEPAFPFPAAIAMLLFLEKPRPSVRKGTPLMGARRIRREQRRVDMAQSRHDNGILKTKERARRDARMTSIIKKGQLPYTPPVLSWLSVQLDKPGRLITQADVDKLLKG